MARPAGNAPANGADPTSVSELNLLTLNCWGLLHISALRTPRLAEIGRQIAALDPAPHIVCLQECWTQDDYRAIRRETRLALPYGKFYFSGAFGGGLAILSRWPIEESSMFKYPLNGRPTAFFRGDWYVGKGIACATIAFGPSKNHVIDVFNTHTHAPYERGPKDSYVCHRTAQAWEMAKLLRAAADRGHLVVALGDFNMLPRSLAHRIITARAPVRDVWRVLHPDSSLGPADHGPERARSRPVPTAAFNLRENGATSDSICNTWQWTKNAENRSRARKGPPPPIDMETPDKRGKRLDYIFASAGDLSSGSAWLVKSASVEMTQRHPDLQVSLSDHFAVFATLRLHPLPEPLLPPSARPASPSTTVADSALESGAYLAPGTPTSTNTNYGEASGASGSAAVGFDAQLRALQRSDHDGDGAPISAAMYDEILSLVHRYTAREVGERYWRGVRFYAALIVWVACLVAVWFSPANFVAFLLMLLSSLGLAAGVVEGLLSLLFFSWEIRALKEFEWEIRNAKAVATGDLAGPLDSDDVKL
ncbi:Endonuclease/exonuclease/phosphatase [Stachybotrys elegans]|uniref:Endonuclease/exonuclease/phosphatase n=1 Tax=Stachybotrys elegans TaxID=80388 RepID=A0A8K0T0R5_9HYPO|nr:Endonuclease/exonuclease/phosphatase [Stachybotrys elegans]